jgi:hypothetical protein
MVKEFNIVTPYKLRKGDLLISGHSDFTALLTRQTKRYWYYFSAFLPHEGRVCKKKLILSLDSGLVDIKYGSMKNRRKRKQKNLLDLHGVAHADADEKIRQFLNFVELPTIIITGNSTRMKEMVESVVSQYGWFSRQSYGNSGILIIEEKC